MNSTQQSEKASWRWQWELAALRRRFGRRIWHWRRRGGEAHLALAAAWQSFHEAHLALAAAQQRFWEAHLALTAVRQCFQEAHLALAAARQRFGRRIWQLVRRRRQYSDERVTRRHRQSDATR